MIYASVCSGVGSCRLAAPSSWECAFFAEIEPFPSAVLAHHFPEVPNHGDFTKIGEDAGPVDVLVGGTPCQSFSVAGKRAGLDSPNGNLAIEFARLAQRLRARWIVWENVPGVLSSVSDDGPSDFDTFLGVLEDVGYSVAWTVLDAQHFGVPQRRRRVFVVGYLGDWRPPAAVLFESDSLRGHSAPIYETREDVAGTLGGGAEARGWSPDTDRMTFVPTTANSLAAVDGKGSDPGRSVGNVVAHALDAFSAGRAKGSGDDVGEVSPTLRSLDFDKSHANGGGQVAVAFAENQRGELHTSDTMPSISTGGGEPGSGYPAVAFQSSQSGVRQVETHATLDANNGSRRHNGVLGGMSIRRLTPRECERLQGLPDSWTLVPYRGKSASDAPRYRAIGNAWAVPVVAWIFRRLDLVEEAR